MKISSFDIFDTCLIRKCGDPNFVFELMAERAFDQPVTPEEKRLFVAARLEAAANSWKETQTINDIYAAFSMKHASLLPKSKLIELEYGIEREMLCPSQKMKDIIECQRQSGNHIVFISDMYLESSFLQSVLAETGFWRDGDSIFVSCDIGATKESGHLYEFIKLREGYSYRSWHHWGDNSLSDIKIPRRLGIHTHRVLHTYSPYQKKMKSMPSLYYQWGGMMAGISRCLAIESQSSAHKDFVLDIIAPLFVPFVFRVLHDAKHKGITSLFFCARDAYPLYRIAKLIVESHLVESYSISVEYLYISRTSLYEGDDSMKIGYLKQIGLASRSGKTAIVDVRSSAKQLHVLNDLMRNNGFNEVFGYLFELCSTTISQREGIRYHTELEDIYVKSLCATLNKLPSNWYMYELFFPLNSQRRTIGYHFNGQEFIPVLESEDNKEYRIHDLQKLVEWRENAIDKYTRLFIQLGLYNYSDEIFTQYAVPMLAEFFLCPSKHYLKALTEFYGQQPDGRYVPYVDDSLIRLPLNVFKHKTVWKRGTIFITLPLWLCKILYKINK